MEEQIFTFLSTASPSEINPFLTSLISKNFDSYEQLTSFLDQCQPKSSCSANWLSRTLVARCKNCGLFNNSCICIDCLLNGNHIQDNHQIYIYYGTTGNCDCGNSESWDRKGFCKKHRGQCDHPEESLPNDIRENLISIFEVLKKFLIPEIEKKSFKFFNEIFDFIIQISKIGEGVLRLASLSFGDEKFIQTILSNCYYFPSNEAKTIKSFLSSYLIDELFTSQLANVVFPYYKIMYENFFDSCHVQESISSNSPLIGPISILSLTFHVFHQLCKEEKRFNFNQFYREIMYITFNFLRSNPSLFEGHNGQYFVNNFWCCKIIMEYFIRRGMKEESKQFFINIASTFSQIEGFIQPIQLINHFDDNSSYYDYELCYNFNTKFNPLPFNLAKKMDYIPEIIEIFVDFLFKNDDIDHTTFLFLLHKLAISTLKNTKSAKEEFNRIIKQNKKFSIIDEKIKNKEEGFENYKNVYEFIYFKACLIPINIISSIMFKDLDLLSEYDYPESYLDTLDQYQRSYYVHIDLPFLLSVIQFMFSFTENKNEFLKLIESKFEIFKPENSQSKSQRMFCFIMIVSYLFYNDPNFIGKKKYVVQLIFMTILKNEPEMSSNDLNYYCGPFELNRAMKWYKEVKFENSWHIILPFISPNELLEDYLPNILHKMTINLRQSNSKKSVNDNSILLPFPEFVDNDIIDLRSMMNSTYLYAIIYDIMYDTQEPLLHHYALNLFILLYNNEQNKISNVDRQINAENIDEIADKVSSNFIEFCDTKINYKRGGSNLSLIDLIENSGSIGLNALNRTLHKRNKKEIAKLMKLKSNIKTIKSKIVKDFNKNALNFNYSTVRNLAIDVKPKPNEKMFINVNLVISTIPDFLENQYHFNFTVKKNNNEGDDEDEHENNFLFKKRKGHLKKGIIAITCGHFSNGRDNNICPHCKSIFNFFLPNFNATNDTTLYLSEINLYLNLFGDLKKCYKILKNLIILLDFRSRLKPEVIQDETTFLLYRNMFLLVNFLVPSIDPSSFSHRKSKLGRFLYDLIIVNHSKSLNFVDCFVSEYIEKFHYKIDYLFLKRVELIRIFLLNNKLEEIIDIDEHFSFRNLINKYKIPEKFICQTKYTLYHNYKMNDINKKFAIDEENLPAFRGIDLPENFLNISKKPFNIQLCSKSGEETLICLATGDIVNRYYRINNMQIPRELSYQPVLIADGSRVNGIGIWRLNDFTLHGSIYRTKKGEQNIGFTNGDPVFIDHESYIDIMDEFLSGNCANKFQNERSEMI